MRQLSTMPESRFIKLLCRKCKNEQIIFNKASTVVKCSNCEEELVFPTGGVADFSGKKIQTLT